MRAALIGTGEIARVHLSCLQQLEGVELVGVCDLSRVSAEWAAERYGARSWYTDHREMLAATSPDVVHITTPVTSHFELARDALDGGAHVIVEKPITVSQDDLDRLLAHADRTGRAVVEDHNWLFNPPVQKLLDVVAQGGLGQVVHADVTFCLDISGPGSPFSDPDVPHPAVTLPGGAVGDFVTHLAVLACAAVGSHRSVQVMWSDEGRGDGRLTELLALMDAEGGTATLRFSDRSRPHMSSLRISGTELSATAVISGRRLVIDRSPEWRRPVASGYRAIASVMDATRAAFASPWERLGGGPGLYIGIWQLIERTYRSLETGRPLPVSPSQIMDVNRLRWDILDQERQHR